MTNEGMRVQNIKAFSKGIPHWNQYRIDFEKTTEGKLHDGPYDLKGASFKERDFTAKIGTPIDSLEFEDRSFLNCRFSGEFIRIFFRKCNFSNCKFEDINFQLSSFANATFSNCVFINCTLHSPTTLTGAQLNNCSFKDCHFNYMNLEETTWNGGNIQSTHFNNCIWENAIFKKFILIKGSPFLKNTNHFDYADTIKSTWMNNLTNWSIISGLGRLPLFEVSWTTFLIALFIIGFIGHLNETQFIKDIIGYPVKLPERFLYILSSSFLLIFGTLLYKWRCPKNIQEFPEQKWVEEMGKPRQIYFNESLIYPMSRLLCATSLILGVGVALIYVIYPQLKWAFWALV